MKNTKPVSMKQWILWVSIIGVISTVLISGPSIALAYLWAILYTLIALCVLLSTYAHKHQKPLTEKQQKEQAQAELQNVAMMFFVTGTIFFIYNIIFK